MSLTPEILITWHGYAWKKNTKLFKNILIGIGRFFEGFHLPLSDIVRGIIKFLLKQLAHSMILKRLNHKNKVHKTIQKLKGLVPESDSSTDKLNGIESIVQIDKTMLNYKCKSHRERSSTNRTDSLVIV